MIHTWRFQLQPVAEDAERVGNVFVHFDQIQLRQPVHDGLAVKRAFLNTMSGQFCTNSTKNFGKICTRTEFY